MRKINKLFGLSAAIVCGFLVAACGQTVHRLEVGGITGGFCVPDVGYVPPEISYFPEDPPDMEKSFTIGGCFSVQDAYQASCNLPHELLRMTVQSVDAPMNNRWREVDDSYFLTDIAESKETITRSNSNNTMLIQHKTTWPEAWISWTREGVAPSGALLPDDELVAICNRTRDMPTESRHAALGEFSCRRFREGRKYNLDYQFLSSSPFPDEGHIRKIEAGIDRQLEQWKCP